MAEEWRQVVGYPRYEVSNLGKVRSLFGAEPRELMPVPNGDYRGYLIVGLHGGGGERKRTMRVHRLVGEAFLGPKPAGLQTRHLDGNATNNHVENLKYGTQAENEADKLRHGTRRPRQGRAA